MLVGLVVFVCAFITTGVAQTPCTTPNGEAGQCIKFIECDAFLEIWRSRTSKNIVFFRASKCGWDNLDPLVCCGSVAEYTNVSIATFPKIFIPTSSEQPVLRIQPVTQTPTPETIETTELYTSPPVFTSSKNLVTSTPPLPTINYLSHPNIHLVPQRGECGLQNFYDRIVGGNETGIDEYPWIALLGYKYDNNESFNCGGSLINERYVLTAAHCVAGRNLIKVRLGEYNISQNPDCITYSGEPDCAPPYQEFTIEEKVWFESYTPRNNKNRWNDIALLRLDRNVTFNDFVKPICLPMSGERSSPKDILTVAGWGLTELNITSEIKLYVQVPMWSQTGCKEVYSIGYNVNLTEKQFCAGGQPGRDSCTGDSGGPLMRTYPGENDYYIEGIVSFGPRPCGKQATPGVYIRVSEYIEWILDTLKPF